MSNEQSEALARGWKLTNESMTLAGLPIPWGICFEIDGVRHIRATRVAQLDKLANAIGAIEEDIARLVQGALALNYGYSDIEQLQQEKSCADRASSARRAERPPRIDDGHRGLIP